MIRKSIGHLHAGMFAAIVAATPAYAATEGESESGGLPQLDFATWPTQLFWLVISFALAYVLMWKLVTPRISSVLEERHNRIQDDMQLAKRAGEEAEEARIRLEADLDAARGTANEAMREATREAKEAADARITNAVEELSRKTGAAEAAIAEARDAALAGVDDIAAATAVEIAKNLAGITPTAGDATAAVRRLGFGIADTGGGAA